MSHSANTDTKSFTLTAFLSFALIFCLFILMANCHGPYHPKSMHHEAVTEGSHHEGDKHEAKEEKSEEHK